MPIKVDLNPYGLMGMYQALRLDERSLRKTSWAIAKSLKEDKRFAEFIRDGAIRVFLDSGTFVEAEENLSRLLELRPFSKIQLREIRGCTKFRGK